jgi:predicted nucleotidyltransferase component of viral defense system
LPVRSTLLPLQYELLVAFARRAPAFYLTGGAALAHFYVGHRPTDDLDFFVQEDLLARGAESLQEAVEEVGATLRTVTDAPDFKRYLVHRPPEGIEVDLVRDRQPSLFPKAVIGGVVVDRPEEILANKLTPSVITRGEPRDIVDIWHLEKSGLRVEDAVVGAMRKEVFTVAELSQHLANWRIGDDTFVPGGLTVEAVRVYVRQLAERLAILAFPR